MDSIQNSENGLFLQDGGGDLPDIACAHGDDNIPGPHLANNFFNKRRAVRRIFGFPGHVLIDTVDQIQSH